MLEKLEQEKWNETKNNKIGVGETKIIMKHKIEKEGLEKRIQTGIDEMNVQKQKEQEKYYY